jgi:hypothetical protein
MYTFAPFTASACVHWHTSDNELERYWQESPCHQPDATAAARDECDLASNIEDIVELKFEIVRRHDWKLKVGRFCCLEKGWQCLVVQDARD